MKIEKCSTEAPGGCEYPAVKYGFCISHLRHDIANNLIKNLNADLERWKTVAEKELEYGQDIRIRLMHNIEAFNELKKLITKMDCECGGEAGSEECYKFISCHRCDALALIAKLGLDKK